MTISHITIQRYIKYCLKYYFKLHAKTVPRTDENETRCIKAAIAYNTACSNEK